MRDAWRLALGMLTVLPARMPERTDRAVAARAMALAPLVVVPLGLLVTLVLIAGRELGLAPLGTAVVALAALALGTRAFHLDGLADTADGLTASHDAERSLQVMRTGDVGPAGAAAIVLVLGVQVGALTTLLDTEHGPWLAGVLVVVSRGALVLTCLRGVPGARPEGLGATHAGSVHPVVAVSMWAVLAAAATAALVLTGAPWWRGPATVAAGVLAVTVLVRHAVRRLGGVTGDVYGAAVELSLAALLLTAS